MEPDKIESLIELIEEDLGYQLPRAVQRVKCDLSASPTAEFRFTRGRIDIRASVERQTFERWIWEELDKITECVGALMLKASVHARDVDAVFLTGGSSYVPAVRAIFESPFGVERIRTGNEFTSVVRGLALAAAEFE